MPWCPKCRYEYRTQVAICPDCEEPLMNQNPNLPEEAPPLSYRTASEVAVIFLLAPWASAYLLKWVPPSLTIDRNMEWLRWLIGVVPVWAIVVLYGYLRSATLRLQTAVVGYAIALFVELLAVAILVNIGKPDSPILPVFFVLMFAAYSVPTVIAAALGAWVQLSRDQSRQKKLPPETENQ